MAHDREVFERTVAEAIRRAKLLFAPRAGNQSTSGNASTTQAGLVPPVPNDATKYLSGAAPPVFQRVIDSDLLLSDVTSNNVSTTKHGFAPKAPNDATKYLDGTGAYSVPAGSGGALPAFPAISNLELRYSARLSQIDTTSDGRVTKWYDISGNARHTNVNVANQRPYYLPKKFNGGYPCLRFNGSSQRFEIPSFTLPQPFTVVAVLQNAVTQGGNQHLFNLASGVITFIGTGPEWFLFAGAAVSPVGTYAQSTSDLIAPDTTIPAVMATVYNGVSSKIRLNAVERTGSPGTNGMASGSTFTIACDPAFTVANFIRLYLYEFLIFSKALSSAEMAQLETYYNDPTVAGIVLA